MEEYITQGKDSFLVDPDPSLLYTERKLAKQGDLAGTIITTSSAQLSAVASRSVVTSEQNVNFPDDGWGNRLKKMPLFTKVEMNRFIENSAWEAFGE